VCWLKRIFRRTVGAKTVFNPEKRNTHQWFGGIAGLFFLSHSGISFMLLIGAVSW